MRRWRTLTPEIPRDGRLVIRPDSGDPVKIICGTLKPSDPAYDKWASRSVLGTKTPEELGVVELLWDIFGGSINEKGYKVLDIHIGVIYGDSISYERADAITQGLVDKGFASTNIVFGVGSFTYQYVTRDSFGMAMKATWVQINGEGRDIFKDPKTDDGVKKSAKGRLALFKVAGSFKDNDPSDLYVIEGATATEEAASRIQPIWVDGNRIQTVTLQDIRERLGTATP